MLRYIIPTKFVLLLTGHVHQVHSPAEHLHLQLGSYQGNDEPQVSVLVPVKQIWRSIRLKSFKHLFQLSKTQFIFWFYSFIAEKSPDRNSSRIRELFGRFLLGVLRAATLAQ